jgi:Flp pilus assembly protein TadG
MLHVRSRNPARRGATVVEMAIVISACLLLLFAIFEYGRFVMMKQLLENATREAARRATTGAGVLTTTDLEATVTQYLAGQPLSGVTMNAYWASATTGANLGPWDDAPFGQPIAVQVNASYAPIFPTFGFLQNPTGLRATALMRSEANN